MFKKSLMKITVVMLMMVTVIAGCGSKTPEAKDILKDAVKALKDVKAVNTAATFNVGMEAEYKENKKKVSGTIEMGMEIETEYTKKPNVTHVEGTVSEKGIEDKKANVSNGNAYYIEEDGDMMKYSYDEDDEEWSKTESDREYEFSETVGGIIDYLEDDQKKLKVKDDGKVDGKDTYKLEGKVDAEIIYEAMKAIAMNDTDDEDDALFLGESIDDMKAKVTAEFYQDSKYPAKVTIDLKDAYNEMLKENEDDLPDGSKFEAKEFKISITYKNFNGDSKIKLPKEFKDLDTDDYGYDDKKVEGVDNPKGPWSEFAFKLDGADYKLPVEYSVLQATGWVIDSNSDAEKMLEPDDKEFGIILKKGENEINAFFHNNSDVAKKVSECIIVGLDIDTYGAKTIDFEAAGLKLNDTEETLNKVYPEFSSKSISTTLTFYYYEPTDLDYSKSVKVIVDKDGKVYNIEYQNYKYKD